MSELVGRVSFFVVGHPEPAGSKRGFPRAHRNGIHVAIVDANPKAKPWQYTVANVAMDKMAGRELFEGAVGLAVVFTLRRPKGHFGVRGLRPSAPAWPIVKPDCTKLLRAVEDALTGVVWRDDAQVVEQSVTKRYGEPEGAHVAIWQV